ncbi:hypothetical protein [Flagellimonas eckloniae]|nr:hypothetical protein [Allomuricauda eckloniae]
MSLGYSRIVFLERNLFQVFVYANNHDRLIGYNEKYSKGGFVYGLWDGTPDGFQFLNFIDDNLFTAYDKQNGEIRYGVLLNNSYRMLPSKERLWALHPYSYYDTRMIYKLVREFYSELYLNSDELVPEPAFAMTQTGSNVYVHSDLNFSTSIQENYVSSSRNKGEIPIITIFKFLLPKSCREEFVSDIMEMINELKEEEMVPVYRVTAISLHIASVIYHGLFFKLTDYFYRDKKKGKKG